MRFTPRFAAAVVAASCLGMIALALAVTMAVDRARPGISRPPPPERSAFLSIRRLDFHQHATPGTLEDAVRVASANGIAALVNLSGGAAGAGLEAQLEAARPFGDRVLVFMNLDLHGCCEPAWSAREAARLAAGKALGARGLVVEESLGLALRSGQASSAPSREALLAVDTPLWDPIWEASARLALPVVVHTGDPGDLFEAFVRLVERHPALTFVGAHFGNGAEDPAAVARLMDRLPNLWVDTAGRVPELGRRTEAARRAILAHPDRVLFGTDLRYVQSDDAKGIVLGAGQPILLDPKLMGGLERRIFFESTYAFFETRDREIPSPTPIQGAWPLLGMGLPRRALEALYHGNAERLLGLKAEGAGH